MEITNNSKNILWVDIAKFIAMFLVVFGHLTGKSNSCQQINQYIYLFHMPIFFVISGYLYKYTNTKNELNKILWRLFIPYLLYQLIYLPFQIGSCIINYNIHWLDALSKCMLGIIIGDGYSTNFSQVVCYPCWFIISLIHIKLIFSFIQINIKNAIIISLISICLLKLLILSSTDLLFCIDNTLYALPYFCCGYLLRNCSNQIYENIKMFVKKYNLFIILVAFLNLYLINKFNGVLQMNIHITEIYSQKSVLLAYLGGLFGTVITILISRYINIQNNITDIIAKNTLFILFFHTILIFVTRALHIDQIIESYSNPVVFYLIYTIFLFAITFLFIKCTSKSLPVLFGKYIPSKIMEVKNV